MTDRKATIWQGHVVHNMTPPGQPGTKHRRLYTPCGWYCVSSTETHEGTMSEVTCDKCLHPTDKLK